MAWVRPSVLGEGGVRAMMFVGALMCLPSGVGIMASAPLSGLTVLGAAFAACGVWFVWMWWPLLSPLADKCTGRSRRLQLIGAVLAAASAVLLGLALWLYFNTEPNENPSALAWTIAVGSAGIACLIVRCVVGIQRQLLHRRRAGKTVSA